MNYFSFERPSTHGIFVLGRERFGLKQDCKNEVVGSGSKLKGEIHSARARLR